jgi:Major tropism determinant N-terminal domain
LQIFVDERQTTFFGGSAMADTKLSALTALTQSSLDTSDEFYVAHSSGSYRIARSELDKQWVQTSLANMADGYAAFDGSGNLDAKVIILNDTAADLASVVLDAGRMAWTTDTNELYVGDGSTTVSSLAPVNPPAVLLTPSGTQTIKASGTNVTTSLGISGGGSGNGLLNVKCASGGTGHGVINVWGSSGLQHEISGNAGISFDQQADNSGIESDGNGTLYVGGNLAFGSLLCCQALGNGPQAISVTADTDVISSCVVCSGTTTAPKLPEISNGAIVLIKNMGSGNCVVKQNSADTGSLIVPTASTTAASTLTLASGAQALFFSDTTLWHRVA